MLSSDLRIVEQYLGALAEGKWLLSPQQAGTLHHIVESCRQRAQAVETHSLVAQVLTPEDLAGNVTLFPVSARPVPAQRFGTDPGRGGAA